MTFSLFQSFKNGEERLIEDEFDLSLWQKFKKVLPLMLGGAAWEDGAPRDFDLFEDGGQLITTYLLTILMLNLLVGILSEKLGEIVAIQTISSYRVLLEIVIQNETFCRLMSGKRCCKNDDNVRAHLVFATAQLVTESRDGEGMVKQIMIEMKREFISKSDIKEA
jgi:hypothetical protein